MKKEFKVTEDFSNRGYIHCNTEEEFEDFKQWIINNGCAIWDEDEFLYNKKGLYYMSSYSFFRKSAYTYEEMRYEKDILIIEWSDYMDDDLQKEFTKNDLKDFMVVELRDGDTYLKFKDKLLGKGNVMYDILYNFNNDLTNSKVKIFDIVKVYNINNDKVYGINSLLDKNNLELIWERKEIKEEENKLLSFTNEELINEINRRMNK